MAKYPNDGGPVFPSQQDRVPDGQWNQTWCPGMSLRAWLAGQSLAGQRAGEPDSASAVLARCAVADADAVLIELERPLPGPQPLPGASDA